MSDFSSKDKKIFDDMIKCVKDTGLNILNERMESINTTTQVNILCISMAITGKDALKDKLTSVAICVSNHPAILFDMIKSKPEDIITLKQLLEDHTAKVFFDAKKALNFFHAAGFEINGPIYDVMLMDKILRAGDREKNLTINSIITQYLGTSMTIDSVLIPVDKEVEILLKLYEVILCQLMENDLLDTATLEFECIRAVAGMERNGIRVDGEKLKDMLQKFTEQQDFFAKIPRQYLGDVNLNSHKKVKEELIKKGVKVKDTRRGTLQPHIFPYLYLWDYQIYKKFKYYRSLAAALLDKNRPQYRQTISQVFTNRCT